MKKMDPYTFQKYLDDNDIESILANGGDDLTESQLKQVKSLGKQLGQMKLDAQRMKLATQPGYAESVLLPLQRKILEQSGNMNYAQAAKIRKKDFPDLMTDKLISGQDTFSSTRSALSDRSKARSMGLKEKFDPLNIAKVLTGGSNLAPAMLGRLLGRNKSDIKYFSGKKEYAPRRESSYYNNYTTPSMSGGSRKATTVLNKMLSFMEKSRTDDMQEQDTLDSFNEMNEKMREDRHKEVVDVFIEATKAKRKAEKQMAKEAKKRERESKKAEKETKKDTGKKEEKPAPAKEAPAPKKEAPPTAKPVETAPTAAPAPPTVTPKAPMVKPTIEAAKTAAKVVMGGSKGLVLAALVAAGYSTAAQANIMANVDKESGFKPRSEEMPKAEKIFSMFGPPGVPGGQPSGGKNKVRFETIQDAKNIVAAGPEAYFNKVYDGRMGNNVPGDGYKYRGRGFIQITGKDMYNRVGKLIGTDLVNNPDLANQPEIAAKIIPAFFKIKAMEKKLKPEQYDDINVVNATVGSADVKSRELRVQLSKSYSEQLNSMSTENADMKKDMSQGSSAGGTVIIQNNNTTQAKNVTHRSAPQEQLNPTMR